MFKIGLTFALSSILKVAGGGQPPTLSNSDGTISATGGYPATPRLTNNDGVITAEIV